MTRTSPSKDITFYDNFVPSLKPGHYTIRVSQELGVNTDQTIKDGGNADIPAHPQPQVTQQFIVRGPRFVLDPADIHRVFPPRNSTGVYHEYLPMVVLNKRALPWERELTLPASITEPCPWIALLVFTDDELPAPGGQPPAGSRQNPARTVSLPLNEIIKGQKPGPPADVLGPEIKLDTDEDPARIHANVIDIPAATFVDLLPSINDLCFLSHVREVSTEDKEPQRAKHEGWYSVVLSNRFATPPPKDSKVTQTTNIVHLVSLEGFESLLGKDAPIRPTAAKVRIISLASWTFTCLQDPQENFRELMLDLIDTNSVKGTDLLVRRPLPDPGGAPVVTDTIGVTATELDGGVQVIAMSAGARCAIDVGSLLYVVDPSGKSCVQVTTADAVLSGATSIPIASHSFAHMPKGSLIGPHDAFRPPTPAARIRQMKAVALTADSLQGATKSISLAGPGGAYVAIPSGTVLQIVDSSGLIRQVVTTSAAANRADRALQIEPIDFKTTMPAGSAIGPFEAYETLNRLTDGYVPLSYAMRSGEDTYAWYRGPLSPVVTPYFLETTGLALPANPNAPQTASAAMIYNPRTGLFDQSYAVAFQTGRSLALASKPFATNLLQWRREAHALVDLLLEYMRSPLLQAELKTKGILDASGNLTRVGVDDLAQLLDANLISDAFKDYLATEFGDGIAKLIGKAGGFAAGDPDKTPPFPATPAPPVPADLIALMQHPDVTLLLEHLSGLTPIGTTSAALSGQQKSIPLDGNGASIAVGVGTLIAVVSQDGTAKAVVTAAQATPAGAAALPIEDFSFATTLPAHSRVLLGEASIMPDQIVQWLAKSALLYDVPFNNLIPDERMLPQGSIRFFYVDRNWIASLLDGALSIAIQSSRDSLFHKLMRDPLHRVVDAVLHRVRDRLRAVSTAGNPPPLGSMAGFFLRSQVVSGWPGLEVRAWSAADDATPMKPLRLDRVSPSVMLGVFPDIPVRLEFNEPKEGLVFGVEDEGVALRYLPGTTGETPANLGQVIPDTWLASDKITKRSAPSNNPALIVGGANGLAMQLSQMFPGSKPTLTPASFAVQMVKVPEQMSFKPEQGTD